MLRSERLRVAVLSALATLVYFFQYLPPVKKIHFYSDIEGYHYPLLNYIYKSLAEGRFPLWDWFIYCGITFIGNLQAGLFYLPNWLLFLGNAGRGGITFKSIEFLYIAHVWLAFFLSYLWLRDRCSTWMPAVLGASVVACSGYLMTMSWHLGMACGFAWMPLGLWGLDQASRARKFQPLWKLVLASAMCLLAGYPSLWMVFCLISCAYALGLPGRTKVFAMTIAALLWSVALSAVQLFPAIEAASLKTSEKVFGAPLELPVFLSYVLPNFYDQNRLTPGPDIPIGNYLYLGSAALLSIVWCAFRPRLWRLVLPGVLLACAAGVILQDPFDLLETIFDRLPLVSDLLRGWNALCGIPLAAALITAVSIDDYLLKSARVQSRSLKMVWVAGSVAFCLSLIYISRRGGPEFAAGLASAAYPLAAVLILAAGFWLYRQRPQWGVAFLILATVFVEYKVFGTNRKFNAVNGDADEFYRGDMRLGGRTLTGLDDKVLAEMHRHPEFRVALLDGPHATDFRHYGLTTPQGFDPFLPTPFKAAVEKHVLFHTNRLFRVTTSSEPLFRRFGVGYLMVRHEGEDENLLLANPSYRRLEPATSYFAVFEWKEAQPVWRFDGESSRRDWTPEHRGFFVQSPKGGRFALIENLFPGWQANIDGRAVPIRLYDGAFQAIDVPSGQHQVDFYFRPRSFIWGALLSIFSALFLGWLITRTS